MSMCDTGIESRAGTRRRGGPLSFRALWPELRMDLHDMAADELAGLDPKTEVPPHPQMPTANAA